MSEGKYYYVSDGQQSGPVTVEELVSKISPTTDIWCPGMPNWAPANTVPEVLALLNTPAAPPNIPDPAATPYNGGSGDYSSGNSQNYGNPGYANQQSFDLPSVTNQNFGNQQGMPKGEKPNNYLVWAIIATVVGFCSCLPLITGIISIVYATNVDKEWNQGNVDGAQKASEKAKLFVIITAALIVIMFVINMISGLASGFLQNIQ
jgi:hypothetical protein